MAISFASTKNPMLRASLKEAVQTNLANDGGLYVPSFIPKFSLKELRECFEKPFVELAFSVLSKMFDNAIGEEELWGICSRAFAFDAPLVQLEENLWTLELFHGPTFAFKDFGVRCMAELLSYYQRSEKGTLTILTATSGDTGGAVADAFHRREGFEVFILYPSGKISEVQELQIAGLGDNITAIEVDGTFDDCQSLVKQVLADTKVTQRRKFCSANSINVARLLPQICYYFRAVAQVSNISSKSLHIAVPSGNFGNVTAGLYAKQMGLPITRLIAATNINDVVPRYFTSGIYQVAGFKETLSTAMDIAHPNNFPRAMTLCHNSLDQLKHEMSAQSFSDASTIHAMKELYRKFQYVSEPHAAVAYQAVMSEGEQDVRIFLGTAHPYKFSKGVSKILDGVEIPVPRAWNENKLEKKSIRVKAEFEEISAVL